VAESDKTRPVGKKFKKKKKRFQCTAPRKKKWSGSAQGEASRGKTPRVGGKFFKNGLGEHPAERVVGRLPKTNPAEREGSKKRALEMGGMSFEKRKAHPACSETPGAKLKGGKKIGLILLKEEHLPSWGCP